MCCPPIECKKYLINTIDKESCFVKTNGETSVNTESREDEHNSKLKHTMETVDKEGYIVTTYNKKDIQI